jgi:hypothetical protein
VILNKEQVFIGLPILPPREKCGVHATKENGGLCAALHTAPKIARARITGRRYFYLQNNNGTGRWKPPCRLQNVPVRQIRSVRRVVGEEDRQAQDLWASHVDRSDCSLVWLWLWSSFEQLASSPDPGFVYDACRICLYYNDIKRTV